jgi:hypothetical protein
VLAGRRYVPPGVVIDRDTQQNPRIATAMRRIATVTKLFSAACRPWLFLCRGHSAVLHLLRSISELNGE